MIIPPLLRAGDTVAIVAPARKVSRADIAYAIDVLDSWGLRVVLGKNLFSDDHSYLSAADERRLDDFNAAIADSSIKAIFCARGGYGSTRILDKLDFSPLRNCPKWVIGFSDITSILLRLYKEGYAAVHGPMPVLFSREGADNSIASLKDLLFTGVFSLKAEAHAVNRLGTAKGRLVGGNLSLIVEAFGTPSHPDFRDTILVIEEIDEYFYKIDRMLMQLKRTGALDQLKGLVVGQMTSLKNGVLPFAQSVHEIILHHTKDYTYPIAFGLPTGHEEPNYAWISGSVAQLKVGEEVVLSSPSPIS